MKSFYTPLYKKSKMWGHIDQAVVSMPAPINLSYWWNFGSLLGLCLMTQIISGIFLSFHYSAHEDTAFQSVVHIHRDVNFGWLLRSIHANGASAFFACLYLHIGRGIFYGAFTQKKVWLSGLTLFLMTMGAAFLGYVLPWGQMSYWGATVITNLLTAIPLVGKDLVLWIWGGFSVSGATLTRFYSLHFILPFALAGLSAIHIILLHEKGSSNPLGVPSQTAKIPFHPYYTTKDFLGMVLFLAIFSALVLLKPHLLGAPENFFPADPLSTPAHIQPEWYFLFAYTILRSMPNKSLGVFYMIFSIISIAYFTMLPSKNYTQGSFWCPPMSILCFFQVHVWCVLTWLGSKPAEDPYTTVGALYTVMFLLFFPLAKLVTSTWENLTQSSAAYNSEVVNKFGLPKTK